MKHHMLLIVKVMLCGSLLICWTPLLLAIQDETAAVCESCGRQSELWLKSVHPSSITLSLACFHVSTVMSWVTGPVRTPPLIQRHRNKQPFTHTCTSEVHSESPVHLSSKCMSLTVGGGQRTRRRTWTRTRGDMRTCLRGGQGGLLADPSCCELTVKTIVIFLCQITQISDPALSVCLSLSLALVLDKMENKGSVMRQHALQTHAWVLNEEYTHLKDSNLYIILLSRTFDVVPSETLWTGQICFNNRSINRPYRTIC